LGETSSAPSCLPPALPSLHKYNHTGGSSIYLCGALCRYARGLYDIYTDRQIIYTDRCAVMRTVRHLCEPRCYEDYTTFIRTAQSFIRTAVLLCGLYDIYTDHQIIYKDRCAVNHLHEL